MIWAFERTRRRAAFPLVLHRGGSGVKCCSARSDNTVYFMRRSVTADGDGGWRSMQARDTGGCA